MDLQATWERKYRAELSNAISARMKGNEGMARVCARRAASIVIGEYLQQQGYNDLHNSIYDRLELFNQLPEVSLDVKLLANRFLLKVNSDHLLPGDADLIEDVQVLADTLLVERFD